MCQNTAKPKWTPKRSSGAVRCANGELPDPPHLCGKVISSMDHHRASWPMYPSSYSVDYPLTIYNSCPFFSCNYRITGWKVTQKTSNPTSCFLWNLESMDDLFWFGFCYFWSIFVLGFGGYLGFVVCFLICFGLGLLFFWGWFVIFS